jgi:hypothetical protein
MKARLIDPAVPDARTPAANPFGLDDVGVIPLHELEAIIRPP